MAMTPAKRHQIRAKQEAMQKARKRKNAEFFHKRTNGFY